MAPSCLPVHVVLLCRRASSPGQSGAGLHRPAWPSSASAPLRAAGPSMLYSSPSSCCKSYVGHFLRSTPLGDNCSHEPSALQCGAVGALAG
eukprot:3894774-Lingulodinium_polyedra.AAC.1